MENQQQEELKREIGILDVAVNVVNISIASGIFLLPAIRFDDSYFGIGCYDLVFVAIKTE